MKPVVPCLVACVFALACGKEESTDRGYIARDGGAGGHEEDDGFVGCPDDIPAFELGAQTAGARGHLNVVMREASAVPPVRYFNDWTLEVTDADGAPLDDVEVVRARAYMRVHNHYGTPDPKVVQHEDAPALFDLERLNLFMRGPWEVQLTLRSESAGEDDVVVNVCVDE